MIKTGIIGCGYWGKILARRISHIPEFHLRYFCDVNEAHLDILKKQYGYVNVTTDSGDLLKDNALDAVVIASPISSHFSLIQDCLRAGKDVFAEQPLADRYSRCEELVDLAEERQRILMVGHIYAFHDAVLFIKDLMASRTLGDIYYIYSQRLNLGRIAPDSNALWELGTHDIFTSGFLLRKKVVGVSAKGISYLGEKSYDTVFLVLDFEDSVTAHIHASWVDPNKIRRVTIVGSEKMVVFDDNRPDAMITIFDKKAKLIAPQEKAADVQTYEEFQLMLHSGDVIIPKIDFSEPLIKELREFSRACATRILPLTDGRKALEVVKILEVAQQSLENNGTYYSL